MVGSSRAGEYAEVMVPGSEAAPDAGDEEKDSDEGVADRRAVASEVAPLHGGKEREHREDEEDSGDAESDDCEDVLTHVILLDHGDVRPLRRKPAGWRRWPAGDDLGVGVELTADFAVGTLVALHGAAEWLRA